MKVVSSAQPAASSLDAISAPRFEDVYREHVSTVARWVARLGGPTLDAEDVTHDVFLKVERELPHFRGDAKLTTWLYALTVNTVRTRRRTERFRRFFRADSTEGDQVSDHSPQPPELLEQKQAQQQLQRVLQQLSERDRQVLVLMELEGRSGKEVAELMQAKLDTVWVWRHRARANFARCLNAAGSPP